jgi:flagellar biogenesis protein FliO
MDTSSDLLLLFRGLLALVAVVTLAVVSLRFGLPWLLRRPLAGRPRRLEVEEYCPLDRQHRLYLVRWDEERLLLATSPDRVVLLGRSPARPTAEAGGAS